MNRFLELLVVAVGAMAASSAWSAEVIEGQIAVIEEGTVTVQTDSDFVPSPGDKVEIGLELPGLDEFDLSALGKVAEVKGDLIVVKLIATLSKIERFHVAKITSDKPTKRTQPKLPGKATGQGAWVVTFDDLKAGDQTGDALAPYGITEVRTGVGQPLVYVPSKAPVLPQGRKSLLSAGSSSACTSTLKLTFAAPLRRFELVRIGVIDGASLPKWRMEAQDGEGKIVAAAGESDWGFDEKTKRFTVAGPGIMSVRIDVDNCWRDGTFATYSTLPIAELLLEADSLPNDSLPSNDPPQTPAKMPDESADLPAGQSRLGEYDEVVSSIAVLSDGRQAISVAHGTQTRTWDLRTTPYVKGKHRLEHGRHIRFWDLRTGTELRQIEFGDETTLCCAVTPDGRRAAVGTTDGTVQIWDLEAGHVMGRLRGHTTWVGAVAISPDGRRVLSGAGDVTLEEVPGNPAAPIRTARNDCTVRLWDVATGRELARLSGHQGMIKSVVFSPDGRKALSSSTDRTTRLWDLETGKEVRRFIERRPLAVLKAVFSPDGNRILTSSGGDPEVEDDPQTLDGQPLERAPGQPGVPDFLPRTDEFGQETDTFALRLWDVASGKFVCSFHGHTQQMESVEFSPDGRRILSGSTDRTVRLWDAESGETVAVFKGHEGAVSCVTFTPDGRRVLSSSTDQTLRVWSLPK